MKTSLLRHRGLRTGLGVVAVLLVGWFGGRSFAVPAGPDDDTASAAAPDHDDSDAGPTTTGSPDAPPPPSESGPVPAPPAPAPPTDPGEGGDTGPDDTSPPPTTEAPTTTTTTEVHPPPGGEIEEDYTWDLPLGNTGPEIAGGPLYLRLYLDDCEGAQIRLNKYWDYLDSPRSVLLYQAAIYFCRDEPELGEQLFDRATTKYGWSGIHDPFIGCQVYATVRSIIEQKAPHTFPCPDGPAPAWPVARVDPRSSP